MGEGSPGSRGLSGTPERAPASLVEILDSPLDPGTVATMRSRADHGHNRADRLPSDDDAMARHGLHEAANVPLPRPLAAV